MTRPLRVGFVVHVMQVAGAEVLVRETIRRLGPAIVPTVCCLDRVGQIGAELVDQGVGLVCFARRRRGVCSLRRKLAAAPAARRHAPALSCRRSSVP